MRHRRLWWFLLALVIAMPSTASATDVSWQLNISNAPPPPVVIVRQQPRTILVPSSTVYVVDDDRMDYDYFRYGVYWYVSNDGYWYRARSYRGPYRVVEVRYVPRAILNVPGRHWRHPHGGPPGQMKKRDVVVVREGRGYDSGHGHGNGKGNKHGH